MAETCSTATYLKGNVTFNGKPYTNTGGSVYLQCNGAYGTGGWASIDSNGHYEMKRSTGYYDCESSKSASCEVYANPSWNESNDTIGPSDHYPVEIDFEKTATQDIPLKLLTHKIQITALAGGQPVTSGLTLSCSRQESPGLYRYTSANTNGVYSMTVDEGTYYCSGYCSNYSNCLFSGNSSTTVTIAKDDVVKTTTLNFFKRDKIIDITVKAGRNILSSGMTVYCSEQESPWTYAYASESDGDSYLLKVTAGHYNCSAYCNYNYYGNSSCPYSGSPSTPITVAESDTTVTGTVSFKVKDKTLRVALVDDRGAPVTSGMTVYASGQGDGWSYSSTNTIQGSSYPLAVSTGRFYVSAYCTNYEDCPVSGYPSLNIEVEEADSIVDLTLPFRRNNATISGAVTDGRNGVSMAGVSVYSYAVSNETTERSAAALKIFQNPYPATTMVSRYISTGTNGTFQMRVPAGSYSVSVTPPWQRTDLGSASMKIVATADSTTAVSLTLSSKSAIINGKVLDAAGNPIAGASISGWSYNGQAGSSDWFWAQTDQSGSYSVRVIEGLRYNVSSYHYSYYGSRENLLCNYNQEGTQTVTAATTSPQTLNFTYPFCSCRMTVNAVDGDGKLIRAINGGFSASPVSNSSGMGWYGIWGTLSGGTGTVQVQPNVAYRFSPSIWDSNYVGGEERTATCMGKETTLNLTLLHLDASIQGCYVDPAGQKVNVSSISYMNVYATKGTTYRSCRTDSGCFTCTVSQGHWCMGYWVDPLSGYASSTPGTSTSCYDVFSGDSLTHDIVLQQTGSIEVTVENSDGKPAQQVWVDATPFSSRDRGANTQQFYYMGNGCLSGSDGRCTLSVGAGKDGTIYFLNAYVPYEMKARENKMNPEEVSVSVLPGKTATAKLSFRPPDGVSVITVSAGDSSVISHATVDCFSPSGGSFEVTTDENGRANCRCTTNEGWKGVAHNLVRGKLWQSEATDITCQTVGSGEGAGSLTMKNLTTIPEGKSATVSDVAKDSLNLKLEDGFSVFFPAGCLGTEGQATCHVDVMVTPFTANFRPASFYGYTVNCQNGDGAPIVQLISNATFTVPVDQVQVENVGLHLEDVHMCFYDDSKGAYSTIKTATIDKTNRQISYQQNHLTAFVVVGNGNLAGLTTENVGTVANEHGPETANIGIPGTGGGTGAPTDGGAAAAPGTETPPGTGGTEGVSEGAGGGCSLIP